jgi:uncharacterized membrane protein YraQ (UPF0718 family)
MAVLNAVWGFFQTQILGMRWLNSIIGALLTRLGVDLATRLGGSLQFFIYDVVKIFILLSVLIFVISYIQSHFPPERTKVILGRFKGIKGNLMGALLGTLTPFCSCSSIPLFIGFTNAGLPLGITFSFLISSPLVDLAAFLLLMSIFGLKIALTYVVVGLVLAVAGGTIIDRLGLEDQVEEFVRSTHMAELEGQELTRRDRINYAKEQLLTTINKVWPYILIGVGIGALIHNWVPADVIQRIVGQRNPFSVILATAVGIPMYADIFGTIPVAEALYLKGVGVGTVLSFMMAVTALSLPSMIMLRRAIKPKLLGIFIAIVSVGIIIIGYTFNALGYLFA